MNRTSHRRRSQSPAHALRSQRGVVLLFSLITLVVLLIAAVALIRSFSNTQFTAGNIAFKRDLQNQSDRALTVVLPKFTTGSLSTSAARANSSVADNYSAMMLPTSSVGVPNVLLGSDADFAAVGQVSNDIAVSTFAGVDQQIRIRYVIDRLCDNTGLDYVLGPSRCIMTDAGPPGKSTNTPAPPPPQQSLFRISVRVSGPRNTQTFFQTTFSN